MRHLLISFFILSLTSVVAQDPSYLVIEDSEFYNMETSQSESLDLKGNIIWDSKKGKITIEDGQIEFYILDNLTENYRKNTENAEHDYLFKSRLLNDDTLHYIQISVRSGNLMILRFWNPDNTKAIRIRAKLLK